MSDYSWEKANADGQWQAQQGQPLAPIGANEPSINFQQRQTAYEQAKKES